MPDSTIAIMGCGWLGLPVAQHLQAAGHSIVASCRTSDKAQQLTRLGLHAIPFQLGDDLQHPDLAPLFAADILILNIPFGRKSSQSNYYDAHMQQLVTHAAKAQIKHVIFISTTSVYGEPSGHINEQATPHPETDSAKANLAIEEWVKTSFAKHYCILRLAGLVGENRHPARYLAGRRNLAQPNKVVNLVHQTDVVQAIQAVINKGLWSETLHLCAQQHPSRQAYYTKSAQILGLATPHFAQSEVQDSGKVIDASASISKLGIQLRYASPYDMMGSKAE